MSQFTQRINQTNQDGTWAGSWYPNGATWILVGWNTYLSHEHYSGFQFRGVTIPQGSIITSAYLKLTAYQTDTNSLNTRIYGIDVDDCPDMSSDPISLSETTAYTDKNFPSGIVSGTEYSWTITSIVQEIVNRTGWGSSQDMGFKLRNNSGAVNSVLHFLSRQNDADKCAYLEINYNPPATLINKSLIYRVRSESSPITKLLRYVITDPEDTPVPFTGVKIAKEPHNVMNTSNPDHLKFSSDYNTLKYYVNDTAQLHVVANAFEYYTSSGYITHDLNYYPIAMIYAKDSDILSNYTPLGWFHAGSGEYRIYSFYVTTTRLYVVVDGWSEVPVNYYVDFYYKIFKNKIIVV